MNLYEELQEVAKNQPALSPDQQLLLKDPAKFFSAQVSALTEDLNQHNIQYEPFSYDWVRAKVLEQQAKHMYREMLQEVTTTSKPTGQSFTFTTMALPLVRKIFDRLISMDLVSVQPINQPTAKIFYMDFLYDDATSLYDSKKKTYSTSSEEGTVKEIDMKITDETVTAIQKKLKAIWSVELEQDLMAYHGLAAETELMTIMQQQIVREVDGMIIAALLAGATGTGTGVGTGAGNVNWNTTGFLADDKSTFERTQYKKTIYEAISDASNLIYKKRYRYASWIIGHPNAIVRLEKLEDFKITQLPVDSRQQQIGRHLVGTLSAKYTVYKDPFFPDESKLLLGYRGDSWSDASGFYAPYIPLYMTPKIIDADDFKPRRGLMSRFAYGTLIKNALATVTLTTS